MRSTFVSRFWGPCRYLLVLGVVFVFHALHAGPVIPVPDLFDEDASDDVVSQPLPENEKPEEPLLKWTAPNYAGQERALGYSPEAFAVPKGFEERVQFWIDIYTKFSLNQGVLHDSRYVQLVYETIDFGDIMKRVDLTDRQKEKERRTLVKERKRALAEKLKSFEKLKDPSALAPEDKRIYDLFAAIDDPRKFSEATHRRRLRFQLGQREQFISGIYQSGRYLKQMEEIFRQEGMPLELTRLPFVESSFNLRARSRVGASGIWQFMRTTARYYMHRDSSADGRNDPLIATRAAARKFRENFQMLGSWPLAVTAYNHGPSGVKRLVRKFETTDIVELTDVRRGRFGFASANFYASFLAALEVERRADKYFGELSVLPELRGVEFQLSKSLSRNELLKYFHDDLEMAKTFNPHVEASVWRGDQPLQRKNIFRVPTTMEAQARSELN